MLERNAEFLMIENYRDVCGVLSEIAPRDIMIAINDDTTNTINKISEGKLNDVSTIFENSFNLIVNTLSEHGKLLDANSAVSYNQGLVGVTKKYIDALSSKDYWWNTQIDVLDARYNSYNPDHLDIAFRFNNQRRFDYNLSRDEHNTLSNKYRVAMHHVLGVF